MVSPIVSLTQALRVGAASTAAVLLLAALPVRAQSEVAAQTAAPVAAAPAIANSNAPRYPVEPCCQLCPHAGEPSAYDASDYLHDFRVLLQGRDGWLFRSQLDLTTTFEVSDYSVAELRRFADALRRRGTELVMVYQPPRGLMDPDKLTPSQRANFDVAAARRNYTAALARIRAAGVTVPPLETLADKPEPYEYFFRRDHHWTPAGSEHTAKVVADAVRLMPAFARIPHKTFTTRTAGLIAKPGTLQKVAASLCGGGYSMQFVPAATTDQSGDASLLGDEAQPDVVLVGTSNSDPKGGYNFGGYLEQYLGADVLNVALTGGSYEGSLQEYLPSTSFQKHPPKVLIWETPYQDYPAQDKNPHQVYRQVVPLVTNGCVGRTAILSKTVDLHAGSNEVLFNGGGRILDINGGNAQLDIHYSDPTIKEMDAVIWYFNGRKESLKMHVKQRVDTAGRFVAELRHDTAEYQNAGFLALTMEVNQPLAKPTRATVELCSRDTASAVFAEAAP